MTEDTPRITVEMIKLFDEDYRQRACSKLTLVKDVEGDGLGQEVMLFLHCSRHRSWALYRDFLHCIEIPMLYTSFLTARAHLEVTVACGGLLHDLQRLYGNRLDRAKIRVNLRDLAMGGYVVPSRETHPHAPLPVRIKDSIKKADRLIHHPKWDGCFRRSYSYLSEGCHPNWLATHMGVETPPEKDGMLFPDPPLFRRRHRQQLIDAVGISATTFLSFFDQIRELMVQHEVMPLFDFEPPAATGAAAPSTP